MKKISISSLGLTTLAVALLLPSLGCASATKIRIGQLKASGRIAITEPGLGIASADDGLGFKAHLGYVQFGYTTTLDKDASHLVLGIESSTGFDNEEATPVTSATHVGVSNLNVGGELAFGLKRITLNGKMKVDDAPFLPAAYLNHWTGATAKYEVFTTPTAHNPGDRMKISKYITFGPLGLTSEVDILNTCQQGSFDLADGQLSTGTGPFLLKGSISNKECSQGLGFGAYIGISDGQ